jgi:nucleoside-diphosphate kinase
MERTLVLVKPDAMERGLAGEIISRLERLGLRIVGLRLLHMDEALARRHYAEHEGKPFFEELIRYITSSPVIAAVFQGNNAVKMVRQAMGDIDPARAAPGTIRGDLGIDIGHNSVHGSDSLETAEKEIRLFFDEGDLFG